MGIETLWPVTSGVARRLEVAIATTYLEKGGMDAIYDAINLIQVALHCFFLSYGNECSNALQKGFRPGG